MRLIESPAHLSRDVGSIVYFAWFDPYLQRFHGLPRDGIAVRFVVDALMNDRVLISLSHALASDYAVQILMQYESLVSNGVVVPYVRESYSVLEYFQEKERRMSEDQAAYEHFRIPYSPQESHREVFRAQVDRTWGLSDDEVAEKKTRFFEGCLAAPDATGLRFSPADGMATFKADLLRDLDPRRSRVPKLLGRASKSLTRLRDYVDHYVDNHMNRYLFDELVGRTGLGRATQEGILSIRNNDYSRGYMAHLRGIAKLSTPFGLDFYAAKYRSVGRRLAKILTLADTESLALRALLDATAIPVSSLMALSAQDVLDIRQMGERAELIQLVQRILDAAHSWSGGERVDLLMYARQCGSVVTQEIVRRAREERARLARVERWRGRFVTLSLLAGLVGGMIQPILGALASPGIIAGAWRGRLFHSRYPLVYLAEQLSKRKLE